MPELPFDVQDLGRLAYGPAYEIQSAARDDVLAAREEGAGVFGRVLLVEHDPVVTVSRRAGAERHLLASPELLRERGVEVAQTDRGGDITYHGPGQLVVYPILDLNRIGIGLHEYMRLLEQAVIDSLAGWGVVGERDPSATGVWVRGKHAQPAKIAAMGVRVRRWVTTHGLSLNVDPDLGHFGLIVPCGLAGRPVTSLAEILGSRRPAMADVKASIVRALARCVSSAAGAAERRRAAARTQG